MNSLEIILIPDMQYQRQVINFNVKGKGRRVIFETRYLERTNKWYVSMFEAQSGAPICTYVPLIASYDTFNNLLEPFTHKNIGWLMCSPVVAEPTSENPERDNLGEFTLFWGDSLE